jgi:hypothetical protein
MAVRAKGEPGASGESAAGRLALSSHWATPAHFPNGMRYVRALNLRGEIFAALLFCFAVGTVLA